jgi:hypothetical protein
MPHKYHLALHYYEVVVDAELNGFATRAPYRFDVSGSTLDPTAFANGVCTGFLLHPTGPFHGFLL